MRGLPTPSQVLSWAYQTGANTVNNTFYTTLANITSQKSAFESCEEKAVEMFVVLPLLKQVGWNTENVSEIYPQRGVSDVGKVDFDLRIDGESRILIEVKRWSHDLDDEDENQLEAYCRSTRPRLAVLTSGRVWRLYLAPTAAKGKNSVLKRFGEVDVTKDELAEVESTFRQFLARDSMADFKRTLSAAKDLYRRLQDYQEQKRLLTEAWDELANDKDGLAELVLEFAAKKGISTSQDNVMRFLCALHGPLVNAVPTGKTTKKPASFVLHASPTGKSKKAHQISKHNGWKNLLVEVGELMQKRHPESFRKEMLSVTDWFAESEDSQFSIPVGDTGVFAKLGSAGEFRDACDRIVTRFGYPRDSLVIKDSKGAIL